MRNGIKAREPSPPKMLQKIAQISPGEGLSERLRGLMENSGDSARDSARDSGDLRGGLRNSGDSDHSFWRTQGRTQGAPPLGLWFVAPCVPIAQPYLYTLSQASGRARHARRGIARTSAVKEALSWWTDFTNSLNSTNAEWHGAQIIPVKHREMRICMGDAGSEWGMGGFDGQSYFLAQWPPHMWKAVQRAKSTSSLHMEALQALVAARTFGPSFFVDYLHLLF